MAQREARSGPRTKVLIQVRLRDGGQERDACLLDVSSGGLLATTAKAPTRGEFVEIIAGMHSLIGHVEWASTRRFGVSLREKIDVAALVRGESGSITLKSPRAVRSGARPQADTVFVDSRSLAQAMQFVVIATAGAAAAVLLALCVHGVWGSLLKQIDSALAEASENTGNKRGHGSACSTGIKRGQSC